MREHHVKTADRRVARRWGDQAVEVERAAQRRGPALLEADLRELAARPAPPARGQAERQGIEHCHRQREVDRAQQERRRRTAPRRSRSRARRRYASSRSWPATRPRSRPSGAIVQSRSPSGAPRNARPIARPDQTEPPKAPASMPALRKRPGEHARRQRREAKASSGQHAERDEPDGTTFHAIPGAARAARGQPAAPACVRLRVALTRPGAAASIVGRFDRHAVLLLQAAEPGDQRVERRGLETQAQAGIAVGLWSRSDVAEARLACRASRPARPAIRRPARCAMPAAAMPAARLPASTRGRPTSAATRAAIFVPALERQHQHQVDQGDGRAGRRRHRPGCARAGSGWRAIRAVVHAAPSLTCSRPSTSLVARIRRLQFDRGAVPAHRLLDAVERFDVRRQRRAVRALRRGSSCPRCARQAPARSPAPAATAGSKAPLAAAGRAEHALDLRARIDDRLPRQDLLNVADLRVELLLGALQLPELEALHAEEQQRACAAASAAGRRHCCSCEPNEEGGA